MAEPVQTTIRLKEATKKDLKIALANQDLKMNTLVEQLIEDWLKNPSGLGSRQSSPSLPQLNTVQWRQMIADSIASHLLKNQDWITEAILDIQLYREGESIFGDRINH